MWIVIRHPGLPGVPAAICADHAVQSQTDRGWVVCSPPLVDRVGVDFDAYPLPQTAEPDTTPTTKTTARKEATQ